eukprot:10117726-Ditylum_brightwellii.AAC.1
MEWSIDSIERNKTINRITSTEIRLLIRASVQAYGEDKLGFKSEEVGTHSNRSAAAMAMYLAGVPVYTIMLIGRWSSDAFLRYIWKQVQEFSMVGGSAQ